MGEGRPRTLREGLSYVQLCTLFDGNCLHPWEYLAMHTGILGVTVLVGGGHGVGKGPTAQRKAPDSLG